MVVQNRFKETRVEKWNSRFQEDLSWKIKIVLKVII